MENTPSKKERAIDPEIIESVERMKALTKADPQRQAAIERNLAKEADERRKSVDEIKNELAKFPAVKEQLTFSFLPNEMTRISPFFPMSKLDMGRRPYEKQAYQNSWGTIEIQGERLAIFDESVMLAVLRLAKMKKAFSFSTSYNEILKIMGSAVGSDTYRAVFTSLKRLTGTSICLTIKAKDGSQKTGLVNTILSGVKFDKYALRISINDYFGAMYLDGFITSIDLDFRSSLRGDITKALYRFYEGQPVNFEIHIEKLCDAINLDKSQPKYQLRRLLNKSLKELIDHKFLEHGKINKKDHIVTKRIISTVKSLDN